MCGLIGFQGGKASEDSVFVLTPNLALKCFNAIKSRGGDAIGVFSPEHGVIKAVNVEHTIFIERPDVKEAIESSLVLGHVRKVSVSDNSLENAHPFVCNGICGMHNGTVTNHLQVAKELGVTIGPDEPKVDSYAIIKCISIHGAERVIPLLEGTFALAWVDIKSKELFLFRHRNPLFVGLGIKENGRYLYFSSVDSFTTDVTESYFLEEDCLYVHKYAFRTLKQKIECKAPPAHTKSPKIIYGDLEYSDYFRCRNYVDEYEVSCIQKSGIYRSEYVKNMFFRRDMREILSELWRNVQEHIKSPLHYKSGDLQIALSKRNKKSLLSSREIIAEQEVLLSEAAKIISTIGTDNKLSQAWLKLYRINAEDPSGIKDKELMQEEPTN